MLYLQQLAGVVAEVAAPVDELKLLVGDIGKRVIDEEITSLIFAEIKCGYRFFIECLMGTGVISADEATFSQPSVDRTNIRILLALAILPDVAVEIARDDGLELP